MLVHHGDVSHDFSGHHYCFVKCQKLPAIPDPLKSKAEFELALANAEELKSIKSIKIKLINFLEIT